MVVAAGAGAASARARRRVVGAFRDAHAFDPKSAIGYQPERRLQARWFERLQQNGAIVPTGDGRYYLNVEALERSDAQRRKRAAVALGVVGLAGLAVLLLA